MKIRFLLPCVAAFFALQCRPQKDLIPTPQNPLPPNASPYLTYLALGDSYTIGHSVGVKQRFPEQLADSLRLDSFDIGHVRIVAKTGWTTDELKSGITSAGISDSVYSFVSLLIGVNNQYRGRSVESYKPEFTELLNQAIAFAGGNRDRVFVVSIPDYAYTPFGNGNASVSQGIDEYNAANKMITEQAGVRYFDITPISRKGLEEPQLVAGDGLHPSGEQYARWVSLMLPEVKKMLE